MGIKLMNGIGMKLRLLVMSDTNWARRPNMKSQIGYMIMVTEDVSVLNTHMVQHIVSWGSVTIKKVCISILAAETAPCVEATARALERVYEWRGPTH